MIWLGNTGRIEIGAHLAKHIFVPGFLEVRAHHLLRIGVGVRAGFAELFSGPQAKQLVAPRSAARRSSSGLDGGSPGENI
jgi:hypothetical protein